MVNNVFAPPPFLPEEHMYLSNGHNSDALASGLPPYPSPLDLPYALQTEPREHVVLDDHHGKTWWTLRITGRSTSLNNLPTFIEGDPITGTLEANLQKPDRIKAITVSVRGLVVYSAYDSKTFVEVSRTIRPTSSGDSHQHSPTPIQRAWLPSGSYCWPFSLLLPPEIQLSEKEAADFGLSVNGKLPPSVRNSHADIDYRITIRIKRSGLFHHDSKLSTSFGYVPETMPDPPSGLRALAYEEGLPVMGPQSDPEGWKIFPEIHLDGSLFKAVLTCLAVSLALPIPLAYPRGTAFPCALIFASSNKQTVHLLSAPNALIVEIRRELQTAVGESLVGGPITFIEDNRRSITKANWFPAEIYESNGVYTCTILGELSLPSDLVPSFALGKFECEYVVDVYPPEAAGFEPATDERLFRTAVTVTSLLAPGPRPRAYLPPVYLAPDV